MVKPRVNGRVLAFAAVGSAACAILMVGIAVWLASSDVPSVPGPAGPLVQVLIPAEAVAFVLLAIGCARSAWFGLRLERRRQAAARGLSAHPVLATEQPVARTAPLTLPVRLGLRATWRLQLLVWPWVALEVIAVGAGEPLAHGVRGVHFFLTLLGALATGSFCACLVTGERQLDVTAQHITLQLASLQETVPWEEARLFAILRSRRGTVSYELASAQASVAWDWVRPGSGRARFFAPTVPHDEYDRQMEALLVLVVAKTGLPLYDLR
jgi:hypothetical protein